MKTTFLTHEQALAGRSWLVVDAREQALGRLASRVAKALRGKNKATFTPHQDGGDFVVVVNADKVKISGNKAEQKIYYRHSGYIGGLKDETMGELRQRKPEELIRLAVRGMMPKTALGKRQLKKLKVYAGESHPHGAQKPLEMN